MAKMLAQSSEETIEEGSEVEPRWRGIFSFGSFYC